MIDIIIDTIIDTLKLIPFLYVTFVIIEYIEHKIDNHKLITKKEKLGPLIGSTLGIFPQCGFSASATNLYATRIITLGTLISIYLSTSDEMLPILLAHKVKPTIIIKILIIKFTIGVVCGFLVDFIYKKREKQKIKEICHHDKCHCEHNHNPLLSALKHTIKISIFILISTFVINIMFTWGETILIKMFKNNNISYLISSLIGLIPNCGASIIITELYLNNTITFGTMMSGLLTGAGIGILILFKTNQKLKENISILFIIYIIGIISGIIIDIII